MLEAGRQLITSMGGATISLEDLGMEDVVHLAGVPRSSAYRLWPYKGDFVNDLLCYLAQPNWAGTSAFDQGTLDLAQEILTEHEDRLRDPEGRRYVLLEAVRRCVTHNFEYIARSPDWAIFVALNATIGSVRDPDARSRIACELQRSDTQFIGAMAAFYEEMLEALGLRFKNPAYRIEHVAMAGAAIVEGLALRKILSDVVSQGSATERQRAFDSSLDDVLESPLPGPADDVGQWSLASLAFFGILESMVEPVPDNPLLDEGSGQS